MIKFFDIARPFKLVIVNLVLTTSLIFMISNVHASQINTTYVNEAYHTIFCPILKNILDKEQIKHDCVPATGIKENAERVEKDPSQLAYGQFDVFALENSIRADRDVFQTIRSDIAKACLFLVTKNQEFSNFGQVAAKAKELRFTLPPENSSHAGTFEYLKQIDANGLGQAKQVIYADSLDAAIEDVLENDDPLAVTMFVQFPDANHKRFEHIAKLGGRFIPVIDRNILRQDISGEKIYFAEETEIINPNWIQKGVKLVTSCTPIILFTGKTENIVDEDAKKDHSDLIRLLSKTNVSDLRPKQDFFTKLWNQTKSLSAKSVEQLMIASEQAREAAGPTLDKAKELTKQAIEASKPGLEKAQEFGKQALDKAKELTDSMLKDKDASGSSSDNNRSATDPDKTPDTSTENETSNKEIFLEGLQPAQTKLYQASLRDH